MGDPHLLTGSGPAAYIGKATRVVDDVPGIEAAHPTACGELAFEQLDVGRRVDVDVHDRVRAEHLTARAALEILDRHEGLGVAEQLEGHARPVA